MTEPADKAPEFEPPEPRRGHLLRAVGLSALVVAVTALCSSGALAAEPAALRAALGTEGVSHGYAELYMLGRCPVVRVQPVRVTFAGAGQQRTITTRNPCRGEWHSSGRYSLPGMAITPHPAQGTDAASLEFGVLAGPVGRHRYTLTAAYGQQVLRATITVAVPAGRGGGRFAITTH